MTSENYRQLLNNEFEAKEMTKEDFDNTLMHFAMLYHTEQCAINDVVGRSEKLPNITLKQAIAKAKPNLDKITDVDKFLDDIR